MGVVVPEIESSMVKKNLVERGYGVFGSSAVIDETASAFEELVDEIVRAAEIETTMKRLLNEAGSTKRRFNALLVQGYPGALGMPLAFIKRRPREMERDETFA